ncbi:MAG: ribosomal L7Ae/L30e/S12e/Gadd45 family protein [Oscillospiraceae bacterium]|nr:ribosomal L7Ae/L30e/S12e/Gadd45 family protein [Oscillospiraceae bacterium]
MKNVLNNISLCRKAGALIIGFDAVIEAAEKGKAKGVLTTRDLSEKTLKEINFYAEKFKTEICVLPEEITMSQIKKITGKQAGVMAVTDDGLLRVIINSE